ncbi:MAG: DEAD/DEAH box helicase [Myxococcales bacterium]
MRFEDLPLPSTVLQGVRDAGFKECTPIQERALPYTLAGRDVAGQAQTGTGKTACFLLTIFKTLLEKQRAVPRVPRALIVAPTRELALQISADARSLGVHTGLSVVTVYGGMDWDKQRRELDAGVDVLIGTPGRLLDYYRERVVDLSHVEVFVIDEADRMFDMGFIRDLQTILRAVPPRERRQGLLFSATLNLTVAELGYRYLKDPVELVISAEHITVEEISQELYHVSSREKISLLLGLLAREKPKSAILFTNTKSGGEFVVHKLKGNGYQADYISGDIPQRKRIKIIEDFKAGLIPFLVATDVASRGLHVEGISHVINFDVPQDAEDYVHRIGRTARAGAVGKAITLADEDFVLNLPAIEDYIQGKIPVVHADDSLYLPDRAPRLERRQRLGGPGRRGPAGPRSGGRRR